MVDIHLPIDVVPGTNPPVFCWSQAVDTPGGKRTVEYREALPPALEVAVARLVRITKQLMMDNVTLRGTIEGLNDRVARMESIGKENEVTAPTGPIPTIPKPTTNVPKKGKG